MRGRFLSTGLLRRARAALAGAALLALLAGALACGRKGDPRPKSDLTGAVAAPEPAPRTGA